MGNRSSMKNIKEYAGPVAGGLSAAFLGVKEGLDTALYISSNYLHGLSPTEQFIVNAAGVVGGMLVIGGIGQLAGELIILPLSNSMNTYYQRIKSLY